MFVYTAPVLHYAEYLRYSLENALLWECVAGMTHKHVINLQMFHHKNRSMKIALSSNEQKAPFKMKSKTSHHSSYCLKKLDFAPRKKWFVFTKSMTLIDIVDIGNSVPAKVRKITRGFKVILTRQFNKISFDFDCFTGNRLNPSSLFQ